MTPNRKNVFCWLFLLLILASIVSLRQSVSGEVVTNLLDANHAWKSINYAKVIQNNSQLDITVMTDNSNRIYNRAFLDTTISSESARNFLSIVYSTNTSRNTMFKIEIVDKPLRLDSNQSIVYAQNPNHLSWVKNIGLTLGFFTERKYEIPNELVNKAIQIRLHLITDEPGESFFNLTRAVILDS